MALERAFHKLGDPNDFASVDKEGFRPSTPAANQWLGEGVYFFLDPNGYRWAKSWPFNASYSPRTNSAEGIVETQIETEHALDLREDEARNRTSEIVEKLRNRLRNNDLEFIDGTAFALIFRMKLFQKVVPFNPTVIIANFDKSWVKYRKAGSRVFLEIEETAIYAQTAQIQACVLDRSIIRKLSLCKA